MPSVPAATGRRAPRHRGCAMALCALAVLVGGALHPPAARAQAAGAATSPADGAVATLRVEDRGGHWFVWADNRLAGPAEVLVDYHEGSNVTSRPLLPARAIVPAGGSRVVAVLRAGDGAGPARFRLRMDSIPGHPSTRPGDVEYALPLAAAARVDQGFGGAFSHDDDENRYALDFAVPPGTPVLAARDGVVMQVEGRRSTSGGDRSRHARAANFVRILHRDGTMALYAHLQAGGVLVAPGQQVRTGDPIGLSGNSGYSTGPHLHFAVQANRGMRLESLPFRMDGLPAPGGPAPEDGLRTRSGP
ncbi:M23 family metallopeptidase [Lysobacter sp. GX 14042]|uniref:M23 family metallopeptidase n=1 Tax=Lysobacter sp. GX 14042 TaxID=2907155 RepID=UPI001F1A0662|nr:M23 family metallopeptidase [Lysobacter sp. GX 14042]MCE7031894.1 M23 family metallopeptidase [Lysobacter sp. GX 14042]